MKLKLTSSFNEQIVRASDQACLAKPSTFLPTPAPDSWLMRLPQFSATELAAEGATHPLQAHLQP